MNTRLNAALKTWLTPGARVLVVGLLAATVLVSGVSAASLRTAGTLRPVRVGCGYEPCSAPAVLGMRPASTPSPLAVPSAGTLSRPPATSHTAHPVPTPRTTLPRAVPTGVDRATTTAINRMHLTAAGYRAFLEHIDRSSLAYAQEHIEFDPLRVPIRQGPSRLFVWHFTAFYRNAHGPAPRPVGTMALRPFIDGLADRGDDSSPPDHVCCAINWVIDRHGPAHQLAPVNAKLRHNPPFDALNTGVEIEAARQADITTRQYESAAYLTIGVLAAQRLLGRLPLEQIVMGHGEMRDAYLLAHPSSHLGIRNDFNAPESRLLRTRIREFLTSHPEVTRIVPRLS